MRVGLVPGEAFFLFDWKQVKPNVNCTNKWSARRLLAAWFFLWPFEPALYNPQRDSERTDSSIKWWADVAHREAVGVLRGLRGSQEFLQIGRSPQCEHVSDFQCSLLANQQRNRCPRARENDREKPQFSDASGNLRRFSDTPSKPGSGSIAGAWRRCISGILRGLPRWQFHQAARLYDRERRRTRSLYR